MSLTLMAIVVGIAVLAGALTPARTARVAAPVPARASRGRSPRRA